MFRVAQCALIKKYLFIYLMAGNSLKWELKTFQSALLSSIVLSAAILNDVKTILIYFTNLPYYY